MHILVQVSFARVPASRAYELAGYVPVPEVQPQARKRPHVVDVDSDDEAFGHPTTTTVTTFSEWEYKPEVLSGKRERQPVNYLG